MRRLVLVALLMLAVPGPSAGRPPTPSPAITGWQPVTPMTTMTLPTPTVLVVPATAEPTASASVPSAVSVSGIPTWYCMAGVSRCTVGHADGPGPDLYAAAGAPLRIGGWRNRIVLVCSTVCLEVTLIDWCACDPSMGHFLDLYHDAWLLLGKPRTVTVSW